MGKLVGISGQYTGSEYLYDASGTITSGGTAQLVLPKARSRSSLILQNISDTDMYFEFGGARATATLTGTSVSSCSITNAGIGYSIAPTVHFYGGQNIQQTMPAYTLAGSQDYPSPNSLASARCIMTGSAPNMTVSSIVIDSGGSNYAYPPMVFLQNRALDPFGSAAPSATSGVRLIAGGGSYTPNGVICTTDQISVFCASSGKAFTCKYSV